MIFLKLNNKKILSYNQQEELYDIENNSNKFSIWLPDIIDNIDINDYKILLYLKKENGEGDIIRFSQNDNIVTLKNIHLQNTSELTIWITGEIDGEELFSTNDLTFKIHKTNIINEPVKDYQLTYFEQIKKELEEFSLEDFKKEIYKHCLWIEEEKEDK